MMRFPTVLSGRENGQRPRTPSWQGVWLAAVLVATLATGARADEPLKFSLVIRDHKFTPAEIHVPSGKPVILVIENQDSTPEEFESNALKVEKVIPAGQTLSVRLRPLGPGRFPFFGDYHQDTAQGAVISE